MQEHKVLAVAASFHVADPEDPLGLSNWRQLFWTLCMIFQRFTCTHSDLLTDIRINVDFCKWAYSVREHMYANCVRKLILLVLLAIIQFQFSFKYIVRNHNSSCL